MAEMGFINFDEEDSCRNYLNSKFNDLLQGINNLYGKELAGELLKRLEDTIALFHEDTKNLIGELKESKEENKKTEEQAVIEPTPVQKLPIKNDAIDDIHSEEDIDEMESEWERHLTE